MFQVAYLRINRGLTLKEIAGRLGLGVKNAEFYWRCAKEKITGLKGDGLRQC